MIDPHGHTLVMKSLFGRKMKEEVPDVKDPEVSPSKESLHDIAENPESEGQDELFRGMETEVWGHEGIWAEKTIVPF